MEKKQIWNIMKFGAVIICIPIIFFLFKFTPCHYTFSNAISDWGNFGDYFSGTIGIIISLLNLIIFIVLTIEIAKINDINNSRNLNFERKKIISELRYESIKRYEEKISCLTDNIGNYIQQQPPQANVIWEVLKTENYFQDFLRTYADIFPNMEGHLLATDILNIKNYIHQAQNNPPLLIQYLDSFKEHNINFINYLRTIMLNEINGRF
jgi:uncharacterized membrane protein